MIFFNQSQARIVLKYRIKIHLIVGEYHEGF